LTSSKKLKLMIVDKILSLSCLFLWIFSNHEIGINHHLLFILNTASVSSVTKGWNCQVSISFIVLYRLVTKGLRQRKSKQTEHNWSKYDEVVCLIQIEIWSLLLNHHPHPHLSFLSEKKSQLNHSSYNVLTNSCHKKTTGTKSRMISQKIDVLNCQMRDRVWGRISRRIRFDKLCLLSLHTRGDGVGMFF
jgi:hypothetical protein